MNERFPLKFDSQQPSPGNLEGDLDRPPMHDGCKVFRLFPTLMVLLLSLSLIAAGSVNWPRFQTNRAHLALLRAPAALSAESAPPASPVAFTASSASYLAAAIQASDLRLASRLLMAAGRRPEAESILSNLPRDPVTEDLLAQLQTANGNWGAALELWRDLEAPSRLVALGDLQKSRNEPVRAIEAYRAAFECRPAYEWAYYRLGWADYGQRRDATATETIFRKALLDFPESPWPAVNIGDLLMETGRTRSALPWYEEALKIAPHEAGLRKKLAWANTRLGDRERQSRNWSAARRAYEAALNWDPDSTEAYHGLARTVWEGEGDLPSALPFLERAIGIAPKDLRLYVLMGDLLREAGQPAAIDWYRRGEELLQSSPPKTAADFADCAGLESRLGHLEAARNCAHGAVRMKPGQAEYRLLLGDIFMELGQPEAALREYRASIALNPTLPGLEERCQEASK